MIRKTNYLILILLTLTGFLFSCRNVNDRITIAAVDPLKKVLKESSYFPDFVKAEADVARGEYATLQFVVRSNSFIKSLKVNVIKAKNDQVELDNIKSGFIGYVCAERLQSNPMRDGIFDYELLKMYEEQDPEKAKELCNKLVQSFKGYDMSISSFRETRKKLLEELSK
jgi:hypothetical protein